MSFFDKVNSDDLKELTDPTAAKARFQKNMRLVEIEVFSYCNRRCWFCPNATVDRISNNFYMDEDLYLSILTQLGTISYDGKISYSRYNEPLADKIILKRIAQARAALPKAVLHTNTNGDYLNAAYIEELAQAGLNSMNIQIYLQNDERYNHQKMKKKADMITRKLGLPHEVIKDVENETYLLKLVHNRIAITLSSRNFEIDGTSRGGQVDINRDYVRVSPCSIPFWAVYIDYNGKMVPCCNFRSDLAAHHDVILEDLTKTHDLFLAFSNRFISKFRESMLTFEKKAGLCADCHFFLEDITDGRRKRIEAAAAPEGGVDRIPSL